jgi:hypothetical protein
MIQPLNDFEVRRAVNFVSANLSVLLKFIEPPIDKPGNIIIIGVQKAREHSRGRATPPLVVGDRP